MFAQACISLKLFNQIDLGLNLNHCCVTVLVLRRRSLTELGNRCIALRIIVLYSSQNMPIRVKQRF